MAELLGARLRKALGKNASKDQNVLEEPQMEERNI